MEGLSIWPVHVTVQMASVGLAVKVSYNPLTSASPCTFILGRGRVSEGGTLAEMLVWSTDLSKRLLYLLCICKCIWCTKLFVDAYYYITDKLVSNFKTFITIVPLSLHQHVVGCVWIKEPWTREPACVPVQEALLELTVKVSAIVNGHWTPCIYRKRKNFRGGNIFAIFAGTITPWKYSPRNVPMF